jgi:hypothetical protein
MYFSKWTHYIQGSFDFFLTTVNLYWCGIIVKKLYRELRAVVISDHTYSNCEYVLQYTYFLNPFVSLYAYRNSMNPLYLADVFGQVVLATSSYYYHNALYTKLETVKPDELNLCDDSIYKIYIFDVVGIQLRTFLLVMVNLLTMTDDKMGSTLIYNMGLLQMVAMNIFFEFSFETKEDDGNRVRLYTGRKTYLSYVIYLPFVITTGILYFHSNDRVAATHVVISSILIGVCMVVKPFYEMNHLFFHLLLYYQTYTTSAVNASLLFPIHPC